MARSASTSLVRHFETLWGDGTVVGLTDRQLLERFNARRDPAAEAAFAALVRRHGPMVLGLCRQVLRDPHHAEDTFQAVFLVLARRAPSIHKPDLLANWLYGVSAARRYARSSPSRPARQLTWAISSSENNRPWFARL
jgi:DNA-directed RNA polymerase specialized sigma24 family protein